MFSKHKCGYLEVLAELPESAHRPVIHGILQIRVVAVFICSVFILAVFTWSVTGLRGWSGGVVTRSNSPSLLN